MNKVILKGRLTKNPDVKYAGSSEPVCVARFSLACEDRERGKKEDGNYPAYFIPCVCMGKTAEIAVANLCRGKEVLICGKMKSDSYTNSEGKKVYTLECFVKEIEFCGKKSDTPMPDVDSFIDIPEGFEGLPFK